STGSRALHFAHLEQMPVMLIGQPLFMADLLFRHISKNPVLPHTLLFATGGYVMPRSLENALRALVAPYCPDFNIIHGYGVAEVDAGCLFASRRTVEGHLVYEPRGPDVDV